VVLVNLLLWPIYTIKDQREQPQLPAWLLPFKASAGPEWVSYIYPGWDERAVVQLYDEWNRLTYEYDPVAQYKPRAARGEYYNVSEHGFRLNGDSVPWPPDPSAVNVFVLGGSTTFGTGLPDRQTIPAALSALLQEQSCPAPVQVYNFGVPGYASREERARFEQLLLTNTIPHIAVFIDGLNDMIRGSHEPRYTSDLRQMMALANTKDSLARLRSQTREVVASLPMSRLAQSLRGQLARWLPGRGAAPPAFSMPTAQLDDRPDHWLANKRLAEGAGERFGVNTLFVWQPVPLYHYDPSEHLLNGQVPAWMEWPRVIGDKRTLYHSMDERRQEPEVARNLLWLADMQADTRENLYVDLQHYNAAFSKDVARAIADELRRRGWLACSDRGVQTAHATATPPR